MPLSHLQIIPAAEHNTMPDLLPALLLVAATTRFTIYLPFLYTLLNALHRTLDLHAAQLHLHEDELARLRQAVLKHDRLLDAVRHSMP